MIGTMQDTYGTWILSLYSTSAHQQVGTTLDIRDKFMKLLITPLIRNLLVVVGDKSINLSILQMDRAFHTGIGLFESIYRSSGLWYWLNIDLHRPLSIISGQKSNVYRFYLTGPFHIHTHIYVIFVYRKRLIASPSCRRTSFLRLAFCIMVSSSDPFL